MENGVTVAKKVLCLVQAQTVRQGKDGVTRAMCLRGELGR